MYKRNTSIDLLKFLAAILITNSHLTYQYGGLSFMAQGGYEGNYIFFFAQATPCFFVQWGGKKDKRMVYKTHLQNISLFIRCYNFVMFVFRK